MSTEMVAALTPNDFQRETSMGNDPAVTLYGPRAAANGLRALALPPLTNNNIARGYLTSFRLPANWTYSTGLTLKIYLTDNGEFAGDLGAKVKLGVKVKRLAANATADMDSGGGTEQTLSVTLSSTAGGIAIGSLAIANANLDSAAAGDSIMIRVRRIASDTTNDTAMGAALLYRIDAQNT